MSAASRDYESVDEQKRIHLRLAYFSFTYFSFLIIRGVSDVGFSIFADTDADADFAF